MTHGFLINFKILEQIDKELVKKNKGKEQKALKWQVLK